MNKEGWIYCGTNKNPDLEGYIKIGKSTNSVSSRENNTNGAGYNVFFAVKVNDCEFYEQLIHKMFEESNYQNMSTAKRKKDSWQEWFNIKFENLLPFLLEIATDFEIRDEDYCTKICKTIKENSDFYKVLIKREPCKYQKLNDEIKNNYGYCPLLDGIDFNKQKKDEMNTNKKTVKQPQQNNNQFCKYETYDKSGRLCPNWNLFFEDHRELVGKKVCFKNGKNDKMVEKYFAKLIKLKAGYYGVFFEGEEMSFSKYSTQLYLASHPDFNHSVQGTYHIYFVETGKNLLDTYNELKFK